MKKLVFTLFSLVPAWAFSQAPVIANDLSLYWGPTYRLDNKFYNSFAVINERYVNTCIMASYQAYGLRVDNFNNNNYAVSLNYARSPLRRPEQVMIPYFGFSPVVFNTSSHIGLNMKPEIGIRFNSGRYYKHQIMSVSLNLSYGYDIPILEENYFLVGRHDLSARIALSFSLNNIRYLLKHPASSDNQTPETKEQN